MEAAVDQVARLSLAEPASVDPDRLAQLYERFGAQRGEDLVCRAMEELAFRLGQAGRLYEAGDRLELRRCAGILAALADEIGMTALRRVAESVAFCIDSADAVALSAVLARMARVGERSLYAIWDLQDLTI
ncbi:hypothetical protein [Salipiger bermudensis]|uniref:Uncharacterized protein n=1 Tax=Salipiger bermudensis (strain DSM 26914 / JCM 13377 / KCTC 12554 / HTCC2601) TaxID=314265 RepID=Q0FRI1_SALBH|nr:hypothetical protein [Salipiger bermudensis]EAU46873.1 hypothetical protein R2601_13664 [Salipiger bermudensis HTCC2601]